MIWDMIICTINQDIITMDKIGWLRRDKTNMMISIGDMLCIQTCYRTIYQTFTHMLSWLTACRFDDTICVSSKICCTCLYIYYCTSMTKWFQSLINELNCFFALVCFDSIIHWTSKLHQCKRLFIMFQECFGLTDTILTLLNDIEKIMILCNMIDWSLFFGNTMHKSQYPHFFDISLQGRSGNTFQYPG